VQQMLKQVETMCWSHTTRLAKISLRLSYITNTLFPLTYFSIHPNQLQKQWRHRWYILSKCQNKHALLSAKNQEKTIKFPPISLSKKSGFIL
jgi:hypothetical protein